MFHRYYTRLYVQISVFFLVTHEGLSETRISRSLDFYGRVLVSSIRIPVYQTFTTNRVFLDWYLLWGRGIELYL